MSNHGVNMSPTSYLSIPSVGKFRLWTASPPEGHDRDVSIGGFVDISELAKRYGADKHQNSKQQYGLFGSISPRSRSSRASVTSSDVEIQEWDSVPTSPYRDANLSRPQTPRTPFAGSRQTNNNHVCHQTPDIITPPTTPKYNRYGRDLYFNTSPPPKRLSEDGPVVEPSRILQDRFDECMPVELAGSLLLPSQGFPQSNPPERPPHVHGRSHSAPVDPIRLLSVTSESGDDLVIPDTSIARCSPPSSTSASGEFKMKKQLHQRDASRSTPSLEHSTKNTLPARKSSLRSRMGPPRYEVPRIPLSHMQLEELMQILPTLDAAIIAHDWIPCMQKRHHELKNSLGKMQLTQAPEASFDFLNKACPDLKTFMTAANIEKELEKIFDQSRDMANTYYKLFEVAKELQDADLQKTAADIDEANAQQSEAKIVLARYVSKHRETCEGYERELQRLRDMMRRSLEMLSSFIHERLGEATRHAPDLQTQQVLELLKTVDKLRDLPVRYISSDLYHDTHQALKEANEEKRELQRMCSEQMVTIRDQSRDLDQYIARMAKVIRMMQEKEHENRKLAAQNKELELMAEAHKNAMRVDQQSELDHEQFQRATSGTQSTNSSVENELWVRDAEIRNLRRKLENVVNREKELQVQVRSLLQSSQLDNGPNRTGRLKRLLTGGPRGDSTSPTLPMTKSMLNLSNSIFTPFDKEKPRIAVAPLPVSGRSSPSLAGLCGSTVMDHLELPPPHINYDRTQSSAGFGPRLREGVQYSLDRDIDSAVSGRFHHMPSNVKSASSNSRPQTPRKYSDASYDAIPEFGRPRLNSAPEPSDLRTEPIRQAHIELDGQPSVNHHRVLSGITEVTEDTGSVKRRSSSPDTNSEDRRMYLDSMHALGRLQVHY